MFLVMGNCIKREIAGALQRIKKNNNKNNSQLSTFSEVNLLYTTEQNI